MKPKFSMRRGYRILYLYCESCSAERPFNRINSWANSQKKVIHRVDGKFVWLPSPDAVENISANDRLVHAACMVCDTGALYIVSTNVLNRSRHSLGDICSCGLPAYHAGLHLEELRVKAS